MGNIMRSQAVSENSLPPARPDVLAHVAGNVRRLRLAAGLSQARLAEAADLSRRMIVGIEAGEANISLGNLDRLAAALGVSFAELVRDPAQRDTARIEGLLWRGTGEGSSATLLGTAPARREAELWIWSLAAGERYDAQADAAGWHEMLYVLTGTLRVTRAEGITDIPTGDFLIFASDQPYAYVNVGTELVRFTRTVVV